MSNKKQLLQITNVAKTFNDGVITIHALKDVNLEIMQGEVMSLLGVNGAGKTTLSSIIATLNPASAGDITQNGVSIYDDVVAFRRTIGFCPQKPNIDMMLTIEQNLEFSGRYFCMSASEIKERTAYLLKRFGLAKYAQSKASILSGGYKQRFLIARTLMHSPKLVIFDEPTVGLDPHVRRDIWNVIKDLKKDNVTVLLTTHYLDEAEQLSDRVCLLEKGVIQLIDTPENLKKAHGQSNLEEVFIKLIKECEKEGDC
ncbi:ABC transporter ATP-binding protein [Candidatus Babeliales bacterium]|nr:ABC transporter ATP-binding protein [Candidatus Babeliales bacterium]